ncbi:hypothetical protein FACS189444_4900 [Spirochaetia bacterium]|nr:hypothetical protein FACS189444_4900 [Spirochaetia bacterium]
MKGQPRFFCDNCGTEVKRDASSCSHCGRLFASVRCPACGFEGAEDLFSKGCPRCGYSTAKRPAAVNHPPIPKKKNEGAAGSLPLWVYILTVFALVLFLWFLLYKWQ